MSLKLMLFTWSGMILILMVTPGLRADVLELQNGDRFSGKVISVSPDTVVLTNDVLGKIPVPRNKVVSLSFGTNAVVPMLTGAPTQPVSTNVPTLTAPPVVVNTNRDL